jgi:heterodisulfide reductase subunit B
MMKFALFLGCKIPYYLNHYGVATQAVLNALKVECVDIEFNCCGYPTRLLDAEAFLFSAIRNLALAEAKGLDIVTPCKCCFGSFQHARHMLSKDSKTRQRLNAVLAEEGLHWEGTAKVKHLLSMLVHDVGVKTIATKVTHRFNDMAVAAHYGCHALRPSKVTGFDDPLAPRIFEKLIHVTGARSVAWDKRLECCGNPLWEKNSALSIALMDQKLENAKQAGADYLCVACTYCQIQFDAVQHQQLASNGDRPVLASILYPQLLGLSLGLEPSVLGLNQNKIDISRIASNVAKVKRPTG